MMTSIEKVYMPPVIISKKGKKPKFILNKAFWGGICSGRPSVIINSDAVDIIIATIKNRDLRV